MIELQLINILERENKCHLYEQHNVLQKKYTKQNRILKDLKLSYNHSSDFTVVGNLLHYSNGFTLSLMFQLTFTLFMTIITKSNFIDTAQNKKSYLCITLRHARMTCQKTMENELRMPTTQFGNM